MYEIDAVGNATITVKYIQKEVREYMPLKNMHIRVTGEEYDFICALAKGLKCSQAEVIRKALFDKEMKQIVSAYREQVEVDELGKYFECSVDNDTKELLEEYIQTVNQSTGQIRKIGTNISSMIRDIRNGKINGKDEIYPYFLLLMEDNKNAMNKQGMLAQRMADTIGNLQFKVKAK